MQPTMKFAVTLRNGGSKSVLDVDVPVGSTPDARRDLVEDLMKRTDVALRGLVDAPVPVAPVDPAVQAPQAAAPVPVAFVTGTGMSPGKKSAFHAKCNGLGIRNRKIELLNIRFGKISVDDLTVAEGDTILDQLSAVEQGQITIDDLFRAV